MPEIGRGPVLCGSEVIEAELVFTRDQPLGIWQLDGEPLAPMLRAVMAGKADALNAVPSERRASIVQWLRQHGVAIST